MMSLAKSPTKGEFLRPLRRTDSDVAQPEFCCWMKRRHPNREIEEVTERLIQTC
jgi:hypothetical protein